MSYYKTCVYFTESPEPLLPGLMTPDLTKPLPPLVLLSPQQQQQQQSSLPRTLPLLTPILPSVPTTTNATAMEHNEQQLPTPNTFFRHCDDLGLFNDIQNVVVMSPSTESLGDIDGTTVTVTTTAVSSPALTRQPTTSNLLGLSSTAVIKTLMMANPFDETFKQAVLQQQQNSTNPTKNVLNNNNNNDDGELNTPFIASTNVLEAIKNNNSKCYSQKYMT